jgi:hypothetical protein
MSRPRSWLIPLACLAILFVVSYRAALFRDGQFTFRDAGHFYYPLHQRIQQEWNEGRWPLWEPEENGGEPLLGNPTAAVLYPGKVIFALLPYPWAARAYIFVHSLAACLTMFLLMRSWGTSPAGSGIAALSYAFSVPILFQHCNVIFLVGAAWLPLGFHAVDQWLRLGHRMALLELTLVLVMQTLGGDPQTAYVLGLCAGGYALGLAWQRRGTSPSSRPAVKRWVVSGILIGAIILWIVMVLMGARWTPSMRPPGKPARPFAWMGWAHGGIVGVWLLAGLGLLGYRIQQGPRARLGTGLLGLTAAAILAAVLAAAQLIPILEFGSRSFRSANMGTHNNYGFSVEPLRLLSAVWPNVYGDVFARNGSWFEVLPPQERHAQPWVPSLYVGGLTLVLALGMLGWGDGPPWRAWLTGVAFVSLLVGFGEFGSPLWWARWSPAIAQAVGPHDPPDIRGVREDGYLCDGDGSIYWIFSTFLPGFWQFRFPGKFLTFTTLSLTALAGLGLDRLAAVRCRRAAWVAASLLALSLVLLALATAFRPSIAAYLESTKESNESSLFGPIDIPGASAMLRLALVQGAVLQVIALALARFGSRRPAWTGTIALAVVTADLALANARYVLTVPQRVIEGEPKVLQIIAEAERQEPAPDPIFRIHRSRYWVPPRWIQESSDDRLEVMSRWERDTIQPKWALSKGAHYALTEGSMEIYDYLLFFGGMSLPVSGAAASGLGLRPGDLIYYWPRRGFDIWNTRYFVLPAYPHDWTERERAFASFLNQSTRIYPSGPRLDSQSTEAQKRQLDAEDLQIFRNKTVFPRAWVVHHVRLHQPVATFDEAEQVRRFVEIIYPNDVFWSDPNRQVFDPRSLAWVEVDPERKLAALLRQTTPPTGESVSITKYEPQRVELEVTLQQPGLVVLADVYYPGWRLTIDGAEAPIYRANLLMRGALVPAGKHHLVYTYHPASFYLGRWISVAGLGVLGLLAVWFRRDSVLPNPS